MALALAQAPGAPAVPPTEQKVSMTMRKSLGRLSSAALELLLPSARAQACTTRYCVNNSTKTKHKCCATCIGGQVCGSWVSGHCLSTSCPG
jgi:hypothetical protein